MKRNGQWTDLNDSARECGRGSLILKHGQEASFSTARHLDARHLDTFQLPHESTTVGRLLETCASGRFSASSGYHIGPRDRHPSDLIRVSYRPSGSTSLEPHPGIKEVTGLDSPSSGHLGGYLGRKSRLSRHSNTRTNKTYQKHQLRPKV
jgi:hypothetical protein